MQNVKILPLDYATDPKIETKRMNKIKTSGFKV